MAIEKLINETETMKKMTYQPPQLEIFSYCVEDGFTISAMTEGYGTNYLNVLLSGGTEGYGNNVVENLYFIDIAGTPEDYQQETSLGDFWNTGAFH